MEIKLFTAVIAIIGSLSTIAMSYYFTKKREREDAWRKEKLVLYKALISSFSGTLRHEGTPEGHIAFAKACNDLNLVAPSSVLESLAIFRAETKTDKNISLQKHDELFTNRIIEIRKDLGVSKSDYNFKAKLWSSGQKPNKQ